MRFVAASSAALFGAPSGRATDRSARWRPPFVWKPSAYDHGVLNWPKI